MRVIDKSAWPRISSWFFEKADASRAAAKARADAALRAIESRERPDLNATAARNELLLERVQADLDEVRADLAKTSGVLAQKTRQLQRLEEEKRNAPRVTQEHTGGRFLVAGAIVTVAGAVLALAIGSATSSMLAGSSDAPVVHSPVAVAPLAPHPSDAGVDAAASEPDAAMPAPSVEPTSRQPVSTCPRGMRQVNSGTFEIGHPIGGRRDRPRPSRRTLAPMPEGIFCIDREEVAQEELDAWRASTGRTRPERCASSTTPHFPAVCVTDEEAAQFCADRGGSLPSIAEWEAVARVGGVRTAPGTSEWVEDTLPPAVFAREGCGRRPERCGHHMVRAGRIDDDRLPRAPHVLFSWNAPNPEVLARRDLSFRCVRRATSTPSGGE